MHFSFLEFVMKISSIIMLEQIYSNMEVKFMLWIIMDLLIATTKKKLITKTKDLKQKKINL